MGNFRSIDRSLVKIDYRYPHSQGKVSSSRRISRVPAISKGTFLRVPAKTRSYRYNQYSPAGQHQSHSGYHSPNWVTLEPFRQTESLRATYEPLRQPKPLQGDIRAHEAKNVQQAVNAPTKALSTNSHHDNTRHLP